MTYRTEANNSIRCWLSPRLKSYASLCAATAETLSKAFSGFADEQQKLIFWNANYDDALSLSFKSQVVRGLIAWYEERLGQLLFVRLPLFQQALRFHPRWFRRFRTHGRGTHNEAARRIHQGEKIEVTVGFCADGCVVQLERDPSVVDMKLIRMKH